MSFEEYFLLPIRVEETGLPHSLEAITIDEIKLHLGIEDTEDDVLLGQYRDAAVMKLESWLGINFLVGEYTAVFNYCSCICGFEIRQRPFQSIVSAQYYSYDQYNDISIDYYYIRKTAYDTLIIFKNTLTRVDNDGILEAIKITFSSGFGSDDLSVPQDIKQALKVMVAMMYNNRGDCADECGIIPCMAQKFIKKYRRILPRKSRNVICNCYCY